MTRLLSKAGLWLAVSALTLSACSGVSSAPPIRVGLIAPMSGRLADRVGHRWILTAGCSASALVGAFAAVQPDAWRACTSAMAYWGVVGQIAAERMAPDTGTGRYAGALLDVAGTLTHAELAATLRAEALA